MLGPLLFLIYTSYLPEAVKDILHTRCDQFADDTALTEVAPTPTHAEEHLQLAVIESAAGLNLWKLTVNTKKDRRHGNYSPSTAMAIYNLSQRSPIVTSH